MIQKNQNTEQKFTRYEIARIIGARALQVAMDAPPLLKITEAELKEMKYDAIKIAEKEFYSDVLPIAISRPIPRKKKQKLTIVKEDSISDQELEKKAKEVEEEIKENIRDYSSVQDEESIEESSEETTPASE